MTAVDGHVARKRFGQNFLVSDGVVRKIVDAVAARPGDTLVEIGPGLGALTAHLLDRCDRLEVVEIDRDLIARLRERWPAERLAIHEGDALAFDFATLKREGSRLKIVGNLPYNISSPLLFHLVRFAPLVDDLHFMLQKEVVDRMVADPGGGDYGRLSVMLQYHFYMERLFIVPPGAFNPSPKVDTAVVRMIPRIGRCEPRAGASAGIPTGGHDLNPPNGPKVSLGGTAPVLDEAVFARVVTAAFSQRRKMLRNTLRGVATESELESVGIAPTSRAEEVALSGYVRLANTISRRPGTLPDQPADVA